MKFSFGQNWLSFSESALDDEKVAQAREAFGQLTRGMELRGVRFLDIGFGQGLPLFLAAEAGADAFGVDLDPLCRHALEATAEFFPSVPLPHFRIASILDDEFVAEQREAGGYDIVHSWGALHHTGNMKCALANAAALVRPDGFLILSIYNRHWTSPLWKAVKWIFNHVPRIIQTALVLAFSPLFYLRARTLTSAGETITSRGMDLRHDIRDWLGGYPYEYASSAEIEDGLTRLGFRLIRAEPTRGFTGCNEFVFQRKKEAASNSARTRITAPDLSDKKHGPPATS